MRRSGVQRAALAAVVLLALFLRVWQLEDVPAGLYCDEAGNGYNAYALGTAGIDENGTPWPLYVWSFGTSYKNPLFIYGAILPVKLLGLSAFSVRLAAALFGTATVLAIFFLGRAVFGPWVGLWAALFLAVAPWHLHFSRIAFELIVFPLLMVWACTLLVRFTQGRRTLPAALGLCALCVYAYAPAALFVPAFLVGFGVLFLPELLRHWRQFLVAVVVAGAVLAPAAVFFSSQARTGTQYFRRTTFLDAGQPWREQAERFGRNYAQFFSPRFLAEEGDPIFRHAVRDFGELYPLFVPFVVLGAGAALLAPSARATSGVRGVHLASDGSAYDLIKIPAGGSRRPFADGLEPAATLMQISDGRAVFTRAVKIMTEASNTALTRAGLAIGDIDYFVPHQANARIIGAAQRQLGVPDEKLISTVALYGNSSAATIPLSLSIAAEERAFQPGELLLLAAAGAGLTGGAVVFEV